MCKAEEKVKEKIFREISGAIFVVAVIQHFREEQRMWGGGMGLSGSSMRR